MIIKQTFTKHLKTLWIAIFTSILYFLAWWYFKFEFLIFFLIGYILTVVPSFFLHVSYYIRNKGVVAEILPDKIRLEKNGEETVLIKQDIKEIVIYKSASIDSGGIPITAMESYFFVRIYSNNGKKYELTCLMDTAIDKSIRIMQGVNILREKNFLNLL